MGYAHTQLTGTSFFASVHPEDRQALLEALQAACRKVESAPDAGQDSHVYALPWIARYRRVRPAMTRTSPPAQGVPQDEVTSEQKQESVWLEMVGYLTFAPYTQACAGGAGGHVEEPVGEGRQGGAGSSQTHMRGISLFGTERDVSSEIIARVALDREKEGKAAAAAAIEAAQKSLAFAAHELRGPLHSITASLELLADGVRTLDLPPDVQGDLNSVMEGAAALRVLVDDILDSSKLKSGGALVIARGSVDIRRLMESIAHQHESFSMVPLVLEVAPELGQAVLADGTRLRQCLTNGLTNAAKHTMEGVIQIRTLVRPIIQGQNEAKYNLEGVSKHGSLSTKSSAGSSNRPPRKRYMLRYEVVDTGGGLRGADPESLFVENRQGPSAAHARTAGTGLGLPIVRRIASALGGLCGIYETDRYVPKAFLGSTIRS